MHQTNEADHIANRATHAWLHLDNARRALRVAVDATEEARKSLSDAPLLQRDVEGVLATHKQALQAAEEAAGWAARHRLAAIDDAQAIIDAELEQGAQEFERVRQWIMEDR